MSAPDRAFSSADNSGVGTTGVGLVAMLRWLANRVRRALSAAAIKGLLMVFSFEESQNSHKSLNSLSLHGLVVERRQ
jgi:hypothetical protein